MTWNKPAIMLGITPPHTHTCLQWKWIYGGVTSILVVRALKSPCSYGCPRFHNKILLRSIVQYLLGTFCITSAFWFIILVSANCVVNGRSRVLIKMWEQNCLAKHYIIYLLKLLLYQLSRCQFIMNFRLVFWNMQINSTCNFCYHSQLILIFEH